MLVNYVLVGRGWGAGHEGDPILGRQDLKITLKL